MHFKEKTIELACIDSEDKTYHITTETEIRLLSASIQKIGLITLPILKKKGAKFIIVNGFRRIAACQLLGILHIRARILNSDLIDLTTIKIAVAENIFQRALNLIEQARAIHLLQKYLKDDASLVKAASELGLPDNSSIIKKLIELYKLSSLLQGYVLNDTLSLTMALELEAFDKAAGLVLAELFVELKISLNKQKEIINLTREIACLSDSTILEVLQESGLDKIINNKDLDRNKRAAAIRSYLKQKRFPVITAYEKNFKKHVKGLELGNGIKLIPPKNFEGNVYTISLSFKNHAELKQRQAVVNRIIKEKGIESMFESQKVQT